MEEKEVSGGVEPRREKTDDDDDDDDDDDADEVDMLARAGEIGVVLVDPPRAGRFFYGSTLAPRAFDDSSSY